LGHRPLSAKGWQKQAERLLLGRFRKVDMVMGNVRPFLHQLLAGFPVPNGSDRWRPMTALFGHESLDLSIEIDRARLEGEFWCLVIANADFAAGGVRWLPGSSCTDQCLDLMVVRPRPWWQRFRFLRAARQGRHGGLPGVIRFRGQRITIHARRPWYYTADGGPRLFAADPLVLEARPQKLRLVIPEKA
jgi:diacylglycerol kinase family enzyme